MKILKKQYIITFTMLITIISVSRNYITQEKFDPSTVQSRDCSEGKMKCGFNPDPQEIVEAVPLSESTMISHRGLPSKIDFSKEMPPVVNQGRQNSCVGFSVGYYTKSYYEYKKNKWKYDTPMYGGKGEHVFSPAYIYNQINRGMDNGSYFHDALNLVVQKGASPWAYMPYKENDYLSQPTESVHKIARKFKALSYKRIPFNDLNAIKSELAKGKPVIFGMEIDDNFYQLKSEVYDQPGGKKYGGHAMTLVGYDDNKRSPRGYIGAFKVINSWGNYWGDDGYGWISYRTWLQLRPYVYILEDKMESSEINSVIEVEEKYLPSPRNVKASQGTFTNKIVISWKSVPQATAYAIYRLNQMSTSKTQVDPYRLLGYATRTSFEDTNILPMVTYSYIVIAINEKKTSNPEEAVLVQGYATQKQNTIVEVPEVQNINIQLQNNKVYIEWEKIPDVNYYQIRRYDIKQNKWLTWNQILTNNSFVDNNPIPDQINRYSVRGSINKKTWSKWSTPVEIQIAGSNTPPSKPVLKEVSQGIYKDQIIVVWEDVPGAEDYFVWRYNYDSNQWEGPFNSFRKNSFIDKDPNIQNGKWFAYAVIAVNQAGNSEASNVLYGRTNPNIHRAGEVLPPPKNVVATLKNDIVEIKWDKVEGSDEYYVFRKKNKEKEYQFISNVSAKQTTFQEKFPGNPGDLFFYVVRSKSALGKESENSQSVSIFKNPNVEAVSHRLMAGLGIDVFLGEWKSSQWDGKDKVRNYILSISNDNDIMIVDLNADNKKSKYTTQYPSLTTEVRFSDFRLTYDQNFDLLFLEGIEGEFKGKNITFTK